jgi:wyosine [tRNA(Phe)-imidazoG37] synthetase (radical SAM superfamily)
MIELMKAFGPVPSRRLGHSLGINNIPPKICSYSCVYCQLGNTMNMQVERQEFYEVQELVQEVKEKVREAEGKGEAIDYLTFVADGEPTLDINLGTEIELLRMLNIKIAVITNASLVWREDVREDLRKADWVSLKLDALSSEIWRKVDRPHGSLKLRSIMDGMLQFASTFAGELTTETMLIRGINDNREEIERIADFLVELAPRKAYLAVPTRPPAQKGVKAASEAAINMAYQLLGEKLKYVEYLIGYEGNAFASTGKVEDDLLGITSVHPMREEAVKALLKNANAQWATVENLVKQNKLIETDYQGKKFYMRKLPGRRS